jgi:broad specificity phosphatase PhoE
MNSQNRKQIVIIRHGERIDCIDDKLSQAVLHESDPELTELGLKQAFSIGEQLSQEFNNKATRYTIVSSPFSRTLMTASHLINGLKSKSNKIEIALKIDNGLSEFISKSFKECPKKQIALFSDNENHSKYLKEYITDDFENFRNHGIETIELFPEHPESMSSAIKRYASAIKRIREECSENSDIILIITHGYGVQIMCEELNIGDFLGVDFCETFVFEENEDKSTKFLKNIKPVI